MRHELTHCLLSRIFFQFLRNVAKISAKISEQSKDLPEITSKLKELLASVQAVMEDFSRTTPQLPRLAENVSHAADNVPLLKLQTQQAMAELEQLQKKQPTSPAKYDAAKEGP